MRVVNLFAGPGCGKSTTAAGLFHLMKCRNEKVELVTEYAKDLVYSDRINMFQNQEYIFAKQNHKLHRLRNKVEWAITDSPLLLSLYYYTKDMPAYEHFHRFVLGINDTYDNINVVLNRVKPFQQYGRVHDETQSREIDVIIRTLLNENNIRYIEIDGSEEAPRLIYDIITK